MAASGPDVPPAAATRGVPAAAESQASIFWPRWKEKCCASPMRRGVNEPCRPWPASQALAGAARRHSGDMLARGFFSHTNPDGLSASQRLPRDYAQVLKQSGENIWMGSGQNTYDPRHLAGTIMATLMASPGHRQNLLDPQYTHLGVGVAARGQEVRATQIFGQLPAGLALR